MSGAAQGKGDVAMDAYRRSHTREEHISATDGYWIGFALRWYVQRIKQDAGDFVDEAVRAVGNR